MKATITTPGVTAPDFTNAGRFIDWGDRVDLDEHFVDPLALALDNIDVDVELARWAPDSPIAAQLERWWTSQRKAIKIHVGVLPGRTLTIGRRLHKIDGATVCYVRVNRSRPKAVAA